MSTCSTLTPVTLLASTDDFQLYFFGFQHCISLILSSVFLTDPHCCLERMRLLYCYTCHTTCTIHCDNRTKTFVTIFCRLFLPQILFAIILLPDEKCDSCSTCDTVTQDIVKRRKSADISDKVIPCVKTLQRPTSFLTNRSRPIQAR